MQEVYILTGNPGKIKAANAVFNKYGLTVKSINLDMPEIQASTSAEIARNAALAAFKKLNKPVVREDHSFYISELKFPGPYMSYVDKAIDVNHLLKIVDTLEDRSGYYELSAAFVDQEGNLHEFSYKVPVEFALEPRGDKSKNWERIIRFPKESKVFAEYPESERIEIWGGETTRTLQS